MRLWWLVLVPPAVLIQTRVEGFSDYAESFLSFFPFFLGSLLFGCFINFSSMKHGVLCTVFAHNRLVLPEVVRQLYFETNLAVKGRC